MSTEPIEQVLRHITEQKHILVTTRAHPGGDAIASALAFCLLIKQMGKRVDCIISEEARDDIALFRFLPGFEHIRHRIPRDGSTIVEFPLENNTVRSLTYHTDHATLSIQIQPEHQPLKLGAPRIKQKDYTYDTIIVVDTTDLDSLGELYREHTEFFYHTPIINIDHDSDNEHYGELNLVELTAVSTTEIIAMLIEHHDPKLLSPDIATCLLAGIMLESKSFQSTAITPRSLALAGQLIRAGGRREQIVEKVYANKPIGALQIWGRALSKIKTDPSFGIISSVVELNDMEETGASEDELLNAIEHFLAHVPNAQAVILVHPHHNRHRAIVHTHAPHTDLRKVLAPLYAYGGRSMIMCEAINANPEEIIDAIKKRLIEHWEEDHSLPSY